jgi:YHS domain-containing protein
MINNQVFDKDQIPVQVEGKTYYGCCEMCKERLAKDPAARQAVDPVTGKTVDKATAVIGVLPDGKVLYFESAETMAKYEAPPAQ